MRPVDLSHHFDVPAPRLAGLLRRIDLHRRSLPNCAGADVLDLAVEADGAVRARTRHVITAPKFGLHLNLPLIFHFNAALDTIRINVDPAGDTGFDLDIALTITPAGSGSDLNARLTLNRAPLRYRLLMVEPVIRRLFHRFAEKLARFAAKSAADPEPAAPSPVAAADPGHRLAILEALPRHSVGAELGVLMGAFAADILRVVEPRRLHLVDPWIASAEGERQASWYASVDQTYMDALHAFVLDRFSMQIAAGQVSVHRALSWDVLETLPDAALDWVYIDADHAYASVLHDLTVSAAKVRPGGLIAGDDYRTDNWWGDGIVRAVETACASLPVELVAIHGDQYLLRRQ